MTEHVIIPGHSNPNRAEIYLDTADHRVKVRCGRCMGSMTRSLEMAALSYAWECSDCHSPFPGHTTRAVTSFRWNALDSARAWCASWMGVKTNELSIEIDRGRRES